MYTGVCQIGLDITLYMTIMHRICFIFFGCFTYPDMCSTTRKGYRVDHIGYMHS